MILNFFASIKFYWKQDFMFCPNMNNKPQRTQRFTASDALAAVVKFNNERK